MRADTQPAVTREILEELYATYNRRELVHPDPLEFLYEYDDVLDREIVALVASYLAYGRVAQILRSVRRVLDRMPEPAAFVRGASPETLKTSLAGLKHRFTTGETLAALLAGARRAIERHGSLGACFAAGLSDGDETVLPALRTFVGELNSIVPAANRPPLPCPSDGSACKRLNLFLRWMVRRDDVDPGGWDDVPPSKLIVPLDTHMLKIGRALGLTQRSQADLRTAREVTAAFRALAPQDPVRYDFALTRLGIRHDADLDAFLRRHGRLEVS
jgi:uncharacterized protein (TIGR02757 family)